MKKFSFDYKDYHIIVNPVVDNIIEAYCDSENDKCKFRIDYDKDFEDKDKLIKVIESGLKVRIQKNTIMNSLEAFKKMREVLTEYHHTYISKKYPALNIYGYPLDNIEHDLKILNILKHCITFTDNTITFNATITDENEIKLLKEWLNRE